MKKSRCYPKYSYILGLTLSSILFMLALGPIFLITNDKLYIMVIWSILMLGLSLSIFISALILMQYYIIEDGKIVVKSIFGIIVSLDISDCFLKVQNLPTFSGWGGTTYMRWLCVYQKNRKTPIFHTGCSNKKNIKEFK